MENLTTKEKLDNAFNMLAVKKFTCSYSITCLDDLYLRLDQSYNEKFLYMFEDDFKENFNDEGNLINEVQLEYKIKGASGLLKTKVILDILKKNGLVSKLSKNEWENYITIFPNDRKGF